MGSVIVLDIAIGEIKIQAFF